MSLMTISLTQMDRKNSAPASARLAGVGNTDAAILKSLSGRTEFDVRDGAFNGYIGCCVDIHERKELEERLADHAQAMRLAENPGVSDTSNPP